MNEYIYIFIYLKLRVTEREKERERKTESYLPTAGSLHKWPQWPHCWSQESWASRRPPCAFLCASLKPLASSDWKHSSWDLDWSGGFMCCTKTLAQGNVIFKRLQSNHNNFESREGWKLRSGFIFTSTSIQFCTIN